MRYRSLLTICLSLAALLSVAAPPATTDKDAGGYVNLPERISPEALAERLMDLPGSVEVIDVRPAWQFKEYSIPGSINVPVAKLMSDTEYLNDKRPLVIVCRDGSISAAVGGALVQKSSRPIKVLSGGVSRYYDEIMRPAGIASEDMKASGGLAPDAPRPTATPAPAPAPAPATPPPADRPKKGRAGC